MLFLTYWFVLFITLTFPAYWLLRYPPARLCLLWLCCVVFHTHFAGPAGVVPIVVLGIVTYLAGLTRNRVACLAGIVLCVGSLVFYKYTKFLCLEILCSFWYHGGTSSFNHLQPLLPSMPPLAISFFVFEFVHYLSDIWKGAPPLRSPLNFCLFSIFWPSIVAGPVKRYEQFIPALHRGVRRVGSRDVAVGILLISAGVVKKVVADNLTAFISFEGPSFHESHLGFRWLVFVAIGFRILLDFSGYSDMAIGFARMFGIRLPANFNWPYLARNISDFWHRWHISLSTWIRDYVYIPIGGSRHGVVRKVFNGLFAFSLCGLWHGAAWNFLIWGLYHGVGLAICSNYRFVLGKLGAAGSRLFRGFVVPPSGGCGPNRLKAGLRTSGIMSAFYRLAAWALTLLFVNVGWLFFFYPLPTAIRMFELLFTVD